MIHAKRLAEIRRDATRIAGGLNGRHVEMEEILELVTAYEAARDLVSTEGRVNFQIAYAKLTQTLMPEPTK